MSRIINVLYKPCFFAWDGAKHKQCWNSDFTAIVEDNDGKIYIGALIEDELSSSGTNIDEIVEHVKSNNIYEKLYQSNITDFIQGEIEEDGEDALDAVKHTLRSIAESKIEIHSDVKDCLREIRKYIDIITAE